jgi:T5orf172 domain/Domain of unknown function (DUF4041)
MGYFLFTVFVGFIISSLVLYFKLWNAKEQVKRLQKELDSLERYRQVKNAWLTLKKLRETHDTTIADTMLEVARINDEATKSAHQITNDLIKTAKSEASIILHEARVTEDSANSNLRESKNISNKAEEQSTILLRKTGEKADKKLSETTIKTSKMIADTKNEVKAMKADAEQILCKAKNDIYMASISVKEIIKEAKGSALIIAGDAFRALKESDELQARVIAARNQLEGCGSKYMIPTRSLVDCLAEDFDYTEPGRELKIIRERIRALLETGLAGESLYRDDTQRLFAIRFVVDAFNGKVDSILSRARRSDPGTIKQEIEDAFHLVNMNAEVLDSTKIARAYMLLRQEESRLLMTILAIRERNREEQRALRERLRDEEKAQKEYEIELKQATRDEDVARKAVDKIRRQIEESSAVEREEFEIRLREMEQKVVEAEAKKQRSLSMAQQTRSGHIYIISNEGAFGEGVFKIGMTRRLVPEERVSELGGASVPFGFDIHALIPSNDAPGLERELHKRFALFQVNKVNYRKEFFRVPLVAIRSVVQELKLNDVQWTEHALATQFKETKVMDEEFKNNIDRQDQWLSSQYRLKSLLINGNIKGLNITSDEDSDYALENNEID